MSLKYKYPRLKTINLELRDPKHYIENKLITSKLDLEFDFNVKLIDKKYLQFFIHLQHNYITKKMKEEEEIFPIYHSDHLLNFEFEKLQSTKPKYEVNFLAHLLGISITLIKGYYDTVTLGNWINNHSLPVFNPTELIHARFEKKIKANKIEFLNKSGKSK